MEKDVHLKKKSEGKGDSVAGGVQGSHKGMPLEGVNKKGKSDCLEKYAIFSGKGRRPSLGGMKAGGN